MYTRVLPVAILCAGITYFHYSRQEKIANEQKLYMDALGYGKKKRMSGWAAFALTLVFGYLYFSKNIQDKNPEKFGMKQSDSEDNEHLSRSEKFIKESIKDPSLLPLKVLAKPRAREIGSHPDSLVAIDQYVRESECHQKKSFAIPAMVNLRNKCFESIGKEESDEDFPLSYQRTFSKNKLAEAIKKVPCDEVSAYLAKIGRENSVNCPPHPIHGNYANIQERALATIGYKVRPESKISSFPR